MVSPELAGPRKSYPEGCSMTATCDSSAVTSPSTVHQPLHPHLPISPSLPLGQVIPHLPQGTMGTGATLWKVQHTTKIVLSTSGIWGEHHVSRVVLASVPYLKDAKGLLCCGVGLAVSVVAVLPWSSWQTPEEGEMQRSKVAGIKWKERSRKRGLLVKNLCIDWLLKSCQDGLVGTVPGPWIEMDVMCKMNGFLKCLWRHCSSRLEAKCYLCLVWSSTPGVWDFL